jgi:hypothetical protein
MKRAGQTQITRINATDYAVITSTILADGTRRRDSCCRIVGNVLRSHEQSGHIRIGGLLRIVLGPRSFAILTGLTIGQSITLSNSQQRTFAP